MSKLVDIFSIIGHVAAALGPLACARPRHVAAALGPQPVLAVMIGPESVNNLTLNMYTRSARRPLACPSPSARPRHVAAARPKMCLNLT